ncbi:MAG: hypothetical protein ABSD57_10270 [Verrucomicrobiota bacterium]
MPFSKLQGLIMVVASATLLPLTGFSQTTPAASSLPPPNLGDAPKAPKDVSRLPGRGLRPLDVTGSFNVNAASREQVREFFNAVYTSSQGVAMNSTAVTAACTPGTNSTAFQNATLRRINWLRAMAGIPAAVTFSSNESTQDQAAALIMSANNALQHIGIPPTWSCFSVAGTNAADNSNLALGSDGPDAITSYIWDFGANNTAVGHRRWILYPQTQVMAAGDVPVEGSFNSANATWVFDANLGGPRPATSQPFVSWPPAGFVPYQLVFPQWSFALSNADFSAATVSMTSNGVSVAVAIQPYQMYMGENTVVWVPMGLDATSQGTTFPFNGTDTVYSVTVTNIKVNASIVGFTYNVTLFDPAVPGTDYVATAVSGTSTPYLNTGNPYACVPIANPNTTGYQWLTAQTTNGNLTDIATNGLANFTITPTPIYSVITNPPVGSGNCFHLCHTNPVSQFLQLNESLLPATNTVFSFKSLLGFSTTNETAYVQISSDGGANWQDLFVEIGSNGSGESTFTSHSYSLSNYAGQLTLLRFNYAFTSGSYYTENDPRVGWCLENIVVTNVLQAINLATNTTASTNFTFTPTLIGTNVLAVAPVLFTQFPLGWGPFKLVTVVTNPTPVIVLGQPVLTNNQLLINFTISGAASTFHLLQTTQLNTSWTTNSTATFTTNIPGSSYRYAATNNAPVRFYLIQTP